MLSILLRRVGVNVFSLWASITLCACAVSASEPVSFDVPAIVIAEPVHPQVVEQPTSGGELFRLRFTVSNYNAPAFQGVINEYAIELLSPTQSMRVIDFWPKNETYSQYEGSVKIDAQSQKNEQLNFQLSANYPGIGGASASGDYRNQVNVQQSYLRKPTLQTLTSSGTLHQGFGAFFKFRPGPVDLLEGSREVAVLVEVPKGWRADLVQVVMSAAGSLAGSSRHQLLSKSQHWIAAHREGDAVAAAQAQAYVQQERYLRGVAASMQQEVDKRALPTLWHKAGAAVQLIDARIPEDYLQRVLYGRSTPRFDERSSRLPVDLRVAILDYWQRRGELLAMSRGGQFHQGDLNSSQQLAASVH